MPNYFTQILPQFTPMSYEDYAKPAAEAEARHNALNESYNTLSENAAQLLDGLDANLDPEEYRTVMDYVDSLSAASEALARNGIQGVDRTGLNNLRKSYFTNVFPVQGAIKRFQEYQKAHADDVKNGIITNGDPNVRVGAFMHGKNPDVTSVNGKNIYDMAKNGAIAASSRLHEDPVITQELKYLLLRIYEKGGYDANDVAQFLANTEGNPTLQKIMDDALTANGADAFRAEGANNETALTQAKAQALQGLLAGLMDNSKTTFQQDARQKAYLEDALAQNRAKQAHEYAMQEAAAKEAAKNGDDTSTNTGSRKDTTEYEPAVPGLSKEATKSRDTLSKATPSILSSSGLTSEKGSKLEGELAATTIGLDMNGQDVTALSYYSKIKNIQNSLNRAIADATDSSKKAKFEEELRVVDKIAAGGFTHEAFQESLSTMSPEASTQLSKVFEAAQIQDYTLMDRFARQATTIHKLNHEQSKFDEIYSGSSYLIPQGAGADVQASLIEAYYGNSQGNPGYLATLTQGITSYSVKNDYAKTTDANLFNTNLAGEQSRHTAEADAKDKRVQIWSKVPNGDGFRPLTDKEKKAIASSPTSAKEYNTALHATDTGFEPLITNSEIGQHGPRVYAVLNTTGNYLIQSRTSEHNKYGGELNNIAELLCDFDSQSFRNALEKYDNESATLVNGKAVYAPVPVSENVPLAGNKGKITLERGSDGDIYKVYSVEIDGVTKPQFAVSFKRYNESVNALSNSMAELMMAAINSNYNYGG